MSVREIAAALPRYEHATDAAWRRMTPSVRDTPAECTYEFTCHVLSHEQMLDALYSAYCAGLRIARESQQ